MRVFRTRPVIGLAAFLAMAFVAGACHPPPSGLVADYKFQNTRASSVGSPPALTDITDNGSNVFLTDTVDGGSRRVLRFPRGNGLKLKPTTEVPMPTDRYTVAILFRFTEVSGYERILQTKDDNSNAGLYVASGGLCFYGFGCGTTHRIPADTYVQVVVTRNNAGTYVAYVNGELDFGPSPDTHNYATIASGHQLRFFDDDNEADGQESPGRVARIRIWNRALTADEVAGLHRLT